MSALDGKPLFVAVGSSKAVIGSSLSGVPAAHSALGTAQPWLRRL